MNWIILIIGGLFEMGFATCLGKAQETSGKGKLFLVGWICHFTFPEHVFIV